MSRAKLKTLAVSLIAVTLITGMFPSPAFAIAGAEVTGDKQTRMTASDSGIVNSKDETVYAKLSADGSVNSVYVVNHFDVTRAGELTDKGDYSAVTNLSSLEPISQNGDMFSVPVEVGDFYYQGNAKSTELPWDVSIDYTLDGKPIEVASLAGASGLLNIHIKTTADKIYKTSYLPPPADRASNKVYKDNYMLQIQVTLDTALCKGIVAPDASMANAGADKILTFVVLMGKNGDALITTQVSDFAMDPIQIAGLPFAMAFDTPDTDNMVDQLDDLTDAVKKLKDGTSELDDGTGDLASGAAKIQSGASQFGGGLSKLDKGSTALSAGSAVIKSSLTQMSTAAKKVATGAAQSAAGAKQLADGLGQTAAGLEGLKSAVAASDLDPQSKATYLALVDGVKQSAAGADQLSTGLNGDGTAANPGLAAGVSGISGGLDELDGKYGSFNSGLKSYTSAVSALNKNYPAVNSAIAKISKGLKGLKTGTADLADGTGELYDGVADLPDTVQEEIDKMLANYKVKDFKPVSFANPDNKNVELVQFVLSTDAIAVPEPEPPVTDEAPESTILNRIAALFS